MTSRNTRANKRELNQSSHQRWIKARDKVYAFCSQLTVTGPNNLVTVGEFMDEFVKHKDMTCALSTFLEKSPNQQLLFDMFDEISKEIYRRHSIAEFIIQTVLDIPELSHGTAEQLINEAQHVCSLMSAVSDRLILALQGQRYGVMKQMLKDLNNTKDKGIEIEYVNC